jgi:phosphoribosylglycinamide formyltransferase-1
VRIAVLASGSGSNLQCLLDQVHGQEGDIVLVISDRKDAYALDRAKEAGIPAIYLEKDHYHQRLEDLLVGASVDLIVLAGYMKKVTTFLVRRYEHAILNIHPSLIPSFCGEGFFGIHVHERALEYGVKVTGATVHFVDEGMDTGPIIAQEAVIVAPDDHPVSLQMKVLEVEHRLLPQAVKDFCEGRLQVVGRKVLIDRGGEDESINQRIR